MLSNSNSKPKPKQDDDEKRLLNAPQIRIPSPPPKTVKIDPPQDANQDIIYYNITMYNDLAEEKPILAEMNETRVSPIVERCSDYLVGVQRFTVPVNIPLQIYPEQAQADNIYKVAISYLTTTIIKPVKYISYTNIFEYVPNREILSIQQILDMTNAAYKECFDDLIIADPSFAGNRPPFFVYDPNARLFTLYAQDIYSNYQNPANYCAITMTFPFYLNYFNSIPTKGPNLNPPGSLDIVFIVENRLENTLLSGPITYYKMQGEYDPRSVFNHLSGVQFRTSTIPANAEFLQSENNESIRILTDFEPFSGYSNGDPVQFSTSGISNVRLHAMNSDKPLLNIDLKIYIEYKTGQTFPLYLFENDLATVKLVFVKKSLYEMIVNNPTSN
jgi:hypothetical protein